MQRRAFLLLSAAACSPAAAPPSPPSPPEPSSRPKPGLPPAEAFINLEKVEPWVPYAERRATFVTKLARHGPSYGKALPPTPDGVTVVRYEGHGGSLPAWLARPPTKATGLGVGATPQPRPPDDPDGPLHQEAKRPGVVFLHNDFALQARAFRYAKPLVEAGCVVMLPTLRGENGNPGHLELLLGEVDDAAAAVAWLGRQPGVDATRIYVIGHSIGGGIAAMLNLRPEVNVRRTASIGGLYRARTFQWWKRFDPKDLIRFDPDDPGETTMRLFIANLRDMAHPHTAYAGRDDDFDIRYARHAEHLAMPHETDFEVVLVEGDHMSSAHAAVAHLAQRITSEAGVSSPP